MPIGDQPRMAAQYIAKLKSRQWTEKYDWKGECYDYEFSNSTGAV